MPVNFREVEENSDEIKAHSFKKLLLIIIDIIFKSTKI